MRTHPLRLLRFLSTRLMYSILYTSFQYDETDTGGIEQLNLVKYYCDILFTVNMIVLYLFSRSVCIYHSVHDFLRQVTVTA